MPVIRPLLPEPIISLDDAKIVTVHRGRAWSFSLRNAELRDYLFDARWKRFRICGAVGEFVGYREAGAP